MIPFDHWIDRHLRRLEFGRYLQRAAEWLAAFLFVFGGVVLVVKLALPRFWPDVLWIALGAVPVAVVAWILNRRGAFSRAESVAMLDRKVEAGGLLMSLSENPDPRWSDRLPQLERVWQQSLPRVRPVRFARYLALPAVFAIGACLIPLRTASTQTPLQRTAGQQASDQLQRAFDVIEQAAILPKEEQEELAKEIQRLAADAKEKPLTQEKWEAFDALQQKLENRLDTAERAAAKAQDAATMLAEAQAGKAGHVSQEQIAQLEKELKEALEKLNPQGKAKQPESQPQSAGQQQPGEQTPQQRAGSPQQSNTPQKTNSPGQQQGTQQQPGGTQQSPPNGELSKDPAQRQEQLQQLTEFLDKESQRLSEARGQSEQAKGEGEKPGQSGNQQGGKPGQTPGQGTPSRGRADAEMSFGQSSEKQNAKFKETALPKGRPDEEQDDVRGTSAQNPEVKPADSAPRGTLRDSDPSAGQETWGRQLRPRHRNVVRNYFGDK